MKIQYVRKNGIKVGKVALKNNKTNEKTNNFNICCTVFGNSICSKANVKKDKILSDGKAIAKIEKDGCGALSPSCNFYISSLEGEPLITIVALDMIDPMQSNAGNSEGRLRFLRFSFTGINGVAEVRNPAMLATRHKDVAQSIVKARLIKDGK